MRAQAGLVAAYSFNEGAGPTANDLSGNGNNGTLSGGATWNATGKNGGAMAFDGVNGMVTVNNSASLGLTTNMTLEAWIWPTSNASWRTVILKEGSNELAYALYSAGGVTRPSGWIRQGNTSSNNVNSSTAAAVNTWTHVAVTYNGSVLRIYTAGVLRTSVNVVKTINVTSNPLRMGGNNVWGEWFSGMIDDVRIYNRALTAAEISTDMNAPVGGSAISLTAPVSGAQVSGNAVVVTAIASAPAGVAGVQFKLDGANLGAEDTVAPYTVNWNSTASVDGAHSLSATLRDGAGATLNSAAVPVTVSNAVAPTTISITAPSAGSAVSGNVTVSASAFAAVGVAGVQFKVDGVNVGAEDTVAPYSISWNSTANPDGPHTLTATLRDSVGATLNSGPVSVTVSNAVVPTTVSVTAPSNGSTVSGNVTVSATASAAAGVAGVQFKVDGVNQGAEDTTSPYSITWNSTTASNGAHVLSATVRDTGNVTTNSANVNVTVSNVPTVSMTAPAAGNVTGTITVSATASGTPAIAGVQFLLDGASLGAEDTTSPYSVSWNTTTATNGSHTLAARARNTSGATTTTANTTVQVTNGGDPAVVGQWSAVQNWPIVPVDTILLKNGKVLTYDRVSAGTLAQVWDPVTNLFVNVPNNFTDLFCAGHTILSDGRILVVGGHGPSDVGTQDVNIFNPVTQTWSLAASMAYERWYPTSLMLPNGKVFAFTGASITTTDYTTIPEIYDPVANTWTKMPTAAANMYQYGQAYVLPNGKIGYTGNWEFADNARLLDLNTQTWTTLDAAVKPGYSIMYEPGKVLKVGSSGDSGTAGVSSNAANIFDFTAPAPAWRTIGSMQYPRTHHNLTLLPDGNVLVTGGSTMVEGYIVSNAVLTPEMWSPVTEQFTPMAPHVKPRLYHSEALLLPDGRVLVSGGGRDGPGVDQYNVEIFSPPYLFKGARPTITSAPSTVSFGDPFFVQTPDAAGIASVTLIRQGSVTHGISMDSRILKLNFQQAAGGLTVTAPANANLAPPGPYLLWIVNSNGAPSVAAMIDVPLPSAGPPPSAPTSLNGVGGVGTSSLTWLAATSGSGIGNYNVHRSTASGFTPTVANRIAQPAGLAYGDSGLAAGRYYYVVTAEDVNHLVGPPSTEIFVDVQGDSIPPSVSLTAPTNPAVTGSITVSADASDNFQVAGVQFLLDGANLGAEDTIAPYSITWNSVGITNGAHTLAARARDNSGNSATTLVFNITVTNAVITGLVGAYSFSEGTGTSTADRSGTNNNGTLSGATWTAAGKTGNALSFNGTNAMVTIADAASLRLTTGLTLEAWVQPTGSLTNWRTILLKENGAGLAYALYGNTNTNRPGLWLEGNAGEKFTTGTAQLALNVWSHVAATFDGTTLRMYVNGTQVGTLVGASSINVSTSPLRIGGNAPWGEYFQGTIDDVRIYNRALSAAEIVTDMNTPVAP